MFFFYPSKGKKKVRLTARTEKGGLRLAPLTSCKTDLWFPRKAILIGIASDFSCCSIFIYFYCLTLDYVSWLSPLSIAAPFNRQKDRKRIPTEIRLKSKYIMCSTVLSFCRLRYAGCQCVFSQSQFPMFRQAHWWQKLRSSRRPVGCLQGLTRKLFGHFGTHFLAYELSITYMGMSPQRSPMGMWI